LLVSKVNFTSSNFDSFSLKQPYKAPVQNQTVQENTPVENNKNTNDIKKYTLIGAGVLLAAILAFKGKSILKLIKKKTPAPELKPQTPEVKPDNIETAEIKPQTEITPRTAEPVPVVPERYALVDEYDKRMKARAEFRNKTRGRALTPEEKAESDRLRLEWKEISDRIIPEHQSIVKTKTAADFANDVEKKKYIMNYVLPRMYKSEESALDALDMFEQFGFRADYPTDDGVTLVTTLTNLSNSIYSMPKECRSDKLLKRFIEVYGKYADNIPREFPDDDGLYCPLIRYGENGIDIQEDTILKGLELMKKIACQKAMYEGLDTALVSGYNAKFKNSEPVKKALEELKDVVKDMKYRLEVDDFC